MGYIEIGQRLFQFCQIILLKKKKVVLLTSLRHHLHSLPVTFHYIQSGSSFKKDKQEVLLVAYSRIQERQYFLTTVIKNRIRKTEYENNAASMTVLCKNNMFTVL